MAGFPERRATLRDGTPVLLREARPEDAPLVRMGFDQLSDRSRQFRFLRAMPRLSEDDLSFLAGAETNEVIGALDLSGEVAGARGPGALRAPSGAARDGRGRDHGDRQSSGARTGDASLRLSRLAGCAHRAQGLRRARPPWQRADAPPSRRSWRPRSRSGTGPSCSTCCRSTPIRSSTPPRPPERLSGGPCAGRGRLTPRRTLTIPPRR